MMKRLRTVIFWAHLVTGLSAAAIVVIMSATGVLLTYQRQVQSWADTRGLDGSPGATGAAALPPEALLERTAGARAGRPTALRWRRDPAAPVEVMYGREHTLFVNRYTGEILGSGSERARAFFRGVTDWHRWLALSGAGRSRGRAVTGAANLAFLVIVLAGFYLWWPRKLTARALRRSLWFRRGLRGKARDFNWHNVIGIWSVVPLVLVILSAVVISYAWAGALVERIAGANAAAGPERRAPAEQTIAATTDKPPGAAALLRRARAQMPDWQSLTMEVVPRDGNVVFVLDGGHGGQPHRQARLTLNAATGAVVRWEPFSSGARAQRLRSILRYMHTGEVLGVGGQTVAGAASAGAMMLAWTGVSLALRRLRAWLGRRRRFRRPRAAGQEGAQGRDADQDR